MDQSSINEILKYSLPLLTFGLGVLLTPYIERLKSRTKSHDTYKNLKAELNDELEELPKRLIKMAECLEALNHLEAHGEPKPGKTWWYVPRDTSCYFLKDSMETSFRIFNKDQKYAAKSLLTQIDALNGYSAEIKKNDNPLEAVETLKDNYKRFIYTGSCTINTMRTLKKDPRALLSRSDEEVIRSILEEFKINLKPDSLKINKKFTIR